MPRCRRHPQLAHILAPERNRIRRPAGAPRERTHQARGPPIAARPAAPLHALPRARPRQHGDRDPRRQRLLRVASRGPTARRHRRLLPVPIEPTRWWTPPVPAIRSMVPYCRLAGAAACARFADHVRFAVRYASRSTRLAAPPCRCRGWPQADSQAPRTAAPLQSADADRLAPHRSEGDPRAHGGVTDKPFRLLCKRLGAGLAVSG